MRCSGFQRLQYSTDFGGIWAALAIVKALEASSWNCFEYPLWHLISSGLGKVVDVVTDEIKFFSNRLGVVPNVPDDPMSTKKANMNQESGGRLRLGRGDVVAADFADETQL